MTDIAHDMVARQGMSTQVGPVVHDRPQARFLDLPNAMGLERRLSDRTAQIIDTAVRALVEEAQSRATGLLQERRELLDAGIVRLLAEETLGEAELQSMAQAARGAAREAVPAAGAPRPSTIA